MDQVDPVLQSQAQAEGGDQGYARSCEGDGKAFTRCLDENRGEHAMSICGWYFEQLVSFSLCYGLVFWGWVYADDDGV